MVAQPIEDFLTPGFLTATADELATSGFVSDEHDFAPYRETLNKHSKAIEDALQETGHPFTLVPGFLKHSAAGYAYYIYDKDRFEDADAAKVAVEAWLDAKYR